MKKPLSYMKYTTGMSVCKILEIITWDFCNILPFSPLQKSSQQSVHWDIELDYK